MRRIGRVTGMFLVLTLCLALVGAAYAYFSSDEVVAVSSTAGSLDLQVSENGGTNWRDGNTCTWSTPTGWAPGDTATLVVDMRNVGSSGAKMLKVGGENLAGTLNLCDVINITAFDATEFGYADWMGCPMTYWNSIFGDHSLPVTVREFVESSYYGCFWEGGHPPTSDYFDPNPADVKRFKITFEFDPNAGNEYQNGTASFDLKFIATDDTTILGSG